MVDVHVMDDLDVFRLARTRHTVLKLGAAASRETSL